MEAEAKHMHRAVKLTYDSGSGIVTPNGLWNADMEGHELFWCSNSCQLRLPHEQSSGGIRERISLGHLRGSSWDNWIAVGRALADNGKGDRLGMYSSAMRGLLAVDGLNNLSTMNPELVSGVFQELDQISKVALVMVPLQFTIEDPKTTFKWTQRGRHRRGRQVAMLRKRAPGIQIIEGSSGASTLAR
ncbi:hypothetical protein Salat_2732800 [Sesamum alatum]|uniref:Uncharacterized protein n=1 Tax=Sesamum alatum TaxID=300844 RepID=A0AAE1XKP2_9LAMI|nr:hypothetical protein Salat_2732800 [Sesamum alatum]